MALLAGKVTKGMGTRTSHSELAKLTSFSRWSRRHIQCCRPLCGSLAWPSIGARTRMRELLKVKTKPLCKKSAGRKRRASSCLLPSPPSASTHRSDPQERLEPSRQGTSGALLAPLAPYFQSPLPGLWAKKGSERYLGGNIMRICLTKSEWRRHFQLCRRPCGDVWSSLDKKGGRRWAGSPGHAQAYCWDERLRDCILHILNEAGALPQ